MASQQRDAGCAADVASAPEGPQLAPAGLLAPSDTPSAPDEAVAPAPPLAHPSAAAAAPRVGPPSSSSEDDEAAASQASSADGDAEDAGSAASSESDEDYAEVLARFAEIMALKSGGTARAPPSPLLPSFDLAGVAALINSGRVRRIICMCGAGISVSAGIPDFRSPGTGLYSRLQEYNLPHPQAVFEIDFFRRNPRPFYLLAKELFPGTYAPTPTHHFIRLLHDKGLLLRCYTQNIDSLEAQAGLPYDKVIAAHGNFDSAHCIACKAKHEVEYVRSAVMAQEPCYCATGKKGCKGLVKPAIVFFGESLPERFWKCVPGDFEQADLLIVLGTSLVVQPFASLIDRVGEVVPRLLINRERVGEAGADLRSMGYTKGFNFSQGNYRDALFEGDCDEGARTLAQLLGWRQELEGLVQGAGGSASSDSTVTAAAGGEHSLSSV